MVSNMTNRITALEHKTVKLPKVFRIICYGKIPTQEEQKKIDDAKVRGEFVICRLIVKPPTYG